MNWLTHIKNFEICMYAYFQGPNEWLKWALVIKIMDHSAMNVYGRKFKIRKGRI